MCQFFFSAFQLLSSVVEHTAFIRCATLLHVSTMVSCNQLSSKYWGVGSPQPLRLGGPTPKKREVGAYAPGQGITVKLADIKTAPELNTNILHFSLFVFKECFTAVSKFYVS